jgi:hypothetical protein
VSGMKPMRIGALLVAALAASPPGAALGAGVVLDAAVAAGVAPPLVDWGAAGLHAATSPTLTGAATPATTSPIARRRKPRRSMVCLIGRRWTSSKLVMRSSSEQKKARHAARRQTLSASGPPSNVDRCAEKVSTIGVDGWWSAWD